MRKQGSLFEYIVGYVDDLAIAMKYPKGAYRHSGEATQVQAERYWFNFIPTRNGLHQG
jgi:hypothetical protein